MPRNNHVNNWHWHCRKGFADFLTCTIGNLFSSYPNFGFSDTHSWTLLSLSTCTVMQWHFTHLNKTVLYNIPSVVAFLLGQTDLWGFREESLEFSFINWISKTLYKQCAVISWNKKFNRYTSAWNTSTREPSRERAGWGLVYFMTCFLADGCVWRACVTATRFPGTWTKVK